MRLISNFFLIISACLLIRGMYLEGHFLKVYHPGLFLILEGLWLKIFSISIRD